MSMWQGIGSGLCCLSQQIPWERLEASPAQPTRWQRFVNFVDDWQHTTPQARAFVDTTTAMTNVLKQSPNEANRLLDVAFIVKMVFLYCYEKSWINQGIGETLGGAKWDPRLNSIANRQWIDAFLPDVDTLGFQGGLQLPDEAVPIASVRSVTGRISGLTHLGLRGDAGSARTRLCVDLLKTHRATVKQVDCDGVSPSLLHEVASISFTSLQQVGIRRLSRVDRGGLFMEAMIRFSQLSTLNVLLLDSVGLGNEELEQICARFPSLNQLQVIGDNRLTEGWVQYTARLPNLQTLVLFNVRFASDIRSLALFAGSSLWYLRLTGCDWSSNSHNNRALLEAIRKISSLSELDLRGCKISSGFLAQLAELPLEVLRCGGFTYDDTRGLPGTPVTNRLAIPREKQQIVEGAAKTNPGLKLYLEQDSVTTSYYPEERY